LKGEGLEGHGGSDDRLLILLSGLDGVGLILTVRSAT
jgi:hypothetical protein